MVWTDSIGSSLEDSMNKSMETCLKNCHENRMVLKTKVE